MKVLVTGAGGLVGRHLLTHLRTTSDIELYGRLVSEAERQPELVALCPALHVLDLREPEAVRDLLATIKPDQIFHLAGQAYVPRSFEDPWETLENNIRGTLNLLQCLHDLDLPSRILVVGCVSLQHLYGTR